MRLTLTLLLLSALALLFSVALSQPQTDSAAAVIPVPSTDAAVPLAPSADSHTNIDVNPVPLDTQASNTTTDPTNSTASADTDTIKPASERALSALLATLVTSQLTANQRTAIIATELQRMQLLSDQHMSASDTHRTAATMDAWLQLSAADKLAVIRQQQTAYVRAMHMEERRRLADLVSSMDELRQTRADDEANANDGSVRRVRLIRVRPVRAAAAEFGAEQRDSMADFDAQQMNMPSQFNMLQMDQQYGVY